MRYLIAAWTAFICLIACGHTEEKTTWGETAREFSQIYCDMWVACGWNGDEAAQEFCVDQSTFYACETDDTCDVEVDVELATTALDECRAATQIDEPLDQKCYLLVYYNILPTECDAVVALNPKLQD